ncbi:MAG TPA: nucleotide exchange factor GrpE [Myxococcaceae bacterium]|nr:nucleotide exchange factor GrpE [Myxococcaceae bacterium]
MSTPEKGKVSTEISQDVIREALESVQRHDGDPPEDPQSELEAVRAQLDFSQAKGRELMEKLKEAHERMLRAVADLDNYKKRAQKEKEEAQKFGNERLLRDFVPVMDNLDRALEHAKSNADFEGLLTGVAMTRKQFEEALGRHGVKSFSAVGQPFDPHLHEAMQQVAAADVPANHVVSELLRGYTLNERLIRAALVVVAKPEEEGSSEAGAAGAAGDGGAQQEVVPGATRGDGET